MYLHREGIEKVIIKEDCTIRDAMRALNESSLEVILVEDEKGVLKGVATDGDIRRSLLNNAGMDAPISQVINTNFFKMPVGATKRQIIKTMKKHYIKQMPIIDEVGRPVDVVLLKDIWREDVKENKVVLMAGGLGTRLRPLTDEIPKPMLKIGDKPILELLMNRFKSFGYEDIIISLNYKGEIIERYFQDGSDFGVNIDYVIETKRLGTAGAIRLAKDHLHEAPFFVMNCDLLTKVNFEALMNYHINSGNDLTIAVKPHEYTIPYGVINLENEQVIELQEKPTYSCLVSGGIYCLNPSVIDLIPEDEYCDITVIINKLLEQNKKVGSYLINEYWLDIGTINDYDQAIKEVAAGIV